MDKVSVIVSKCVGTGDNVRIIGDRIVDDEYNTLDAALPKGDALRAEGMSVIVRPNYNEKDTEGNYFREWRSFNGEPFRECKWRF